jgi:hypothetical protein
MATGLPDISKLKKKELPDIGTLKKKEDGEIPSEGLPTVSAKELESEAPSISIDEDFIKEQMVLQEPAFSTAIVKPEKELEPLDVKPMSMETFGDIMVDVEKQKVQRAQAEEDKKLFEEFDKARTKLRKEAEQEELREKEKARDKGLVIKKPSKELKEKFESGELEQADFFPDGNYFYGYLKNVNRSTASFFRKINGAEKLIAKGLNKASGGLIPESEGVLGQVADWVDEKAVKGVVDVPDNVAGGVISRFGQMNWFPAELMMTPQAKIKALSTVTGGTINGIPKLATLLGVGGGLEEYSRSEDIGKTFDRAVQGFSDGLFLHMLGGLASKGGMSAATNPMTQQLTSTGILASGFAGKSAYEQLVETGEIDPKEVAAEFTFGAVLSAPEMLKLSDNYFTSSKNTIKSTNNLFKKIDNNKLRKEYKNLIKEERTEGISPEKRAEIQRTKQGIQNLVSEMIVIDDVKRNPDKYRKIVENDKTLNEQEKKFQLDKIDYIEKNVKEIKPKDVKEGISEPLDLTKEEKPTKPIPEKKEAVKEAKIEEEVKPKEKEVKDALQEGKEIPEIEKEVKEEVKPKEEVAEVKKAKEIKKFETKEEFKKDFLSDDINLENIDVPLKMKDKISAAKNLREGKKTKQAEILEDFLDKAFEKGKIELITPDKKTKTAAPIEEAVAPKKEVVEEFELKTKEEQAREQAEAELYKEYGKEAPKKEKAKPDEYQSIGAKDESGQQEMSIKLDIDKENSIDVTKPGSKKEKNKLVKEKAKQLEKEDISTIKKDAKAGIRERRREIGVETLETNLYTHDLQKKFSIPEEEAITLLREKKGFPEKLLNDKAKKAYENPTPEMKQAIKEVGERYDKAWQYIVENTDKMSTEQVKDYVTHLWKIPDKKVNDVVNWFTTKNRFTKKRSIESIKEGIDKFGLEPQTLRISEILRVYESARINAVANEKLVKNIKDMNIEGVKLLLKQNEAPSDWKEIRHPALTYKTFVPSKKVGAPATLHKSYYKVHPEIKRSLESILESGTIDNLTLEKIAKGYEGISGFLKKVNLSVSLFHHQALTETAIATMGLRKTLKVLGKDLLWDGLTGKGKPAFKNPEIARDAVKHLVQLGATQDIPVKNIARGLDKLAEKAKGIPVAEQLAKGLAKGNEAWDRMLWDYLHDGLKIYGYESLAEKVRTKSIKEGWTPEQTEKALDEMGQLVNDTFGGQNWDILGVSPKQQRVLRWMLLSPDWTISTVRQALSPLGVGSMYKNDKFWKEATKKGTPANARAKAGRNFWIKAALYYGVGINLLNVMNRLADEKENPENYPDKDKPLKDKIIDYSMHGNTIGHNTHLFSGRYEDGSEKYLRWGKQFRELPELFMDEEGVNFPKSAIKKIGGKANPLAQYLTQLATGHTLSGYENWDLKDKRGLDWIGGALKTTGKAAFPYSTATAFRDDKEWSPTDLFMPASKGMTPSKAIDLFQKGLNFEDGFDYDEKYIEEVYQGAIANNLDALSLFKIAARNKEAEATRALKQNLKSTKAIQKKLKETTNLAQKEKLFDELEKLRERKLNISTARNNFIEIDSYLKEKEIEYLKLEEDN